MDFKKNYEIFWKSLRCKYLILKKIKDYYLQDVVVNCYINGSALSKNNYHIKKMIDDRLMNPFLSYINISIAFNLFLKID